MQYNTPIPCPPVTLASRYWPALLLPAGGLDCGITDLTACTDSMQYNLLRGLAETIWSGDRALLLLAYQLDHLRWWMTSQAFLSAYTAVRAIAEPLLSPLAMLAIMLGLLLFLLMPALGRIELINIRQVLIWLVFAPALLTEAGPLLITLEQTRSDIATILAGQVGQVAANDIFGAPQHDPENPLMTPQPLYPAYAEASACANGQITRPPRVEDAPLPAMLHADDLAAALLLANAQDIHCPGEAGPTSTLPDGFVASPDGDQVLGVYVVNAADLDRLQPAERVTAIQRIQRGITRLAFGSVTCILAVLEGLMQLVFALSLVVIWLSLPIAVTLVLFSPSLRPLGSLIQRAISVMTTSWVVSVLFGLLTACLVGAAGIGNPDALVALSVGGVVFAIYLVRIAAATCTGSMRLIGDLFSTGMGVALGAAGSATMRVITTQVRSANLPTPDLRTPTSRYLRSQATHIRTASGLAFQRIRSLTPVGAVARSMATEPQPERVRPSRRTASQSQDQ